MGISPGLFLVMAVEILIFVSFVGSIILTMSTSRTAKRYRDYVLELKKEDKYVEWVEQHKNLVMLNKVYQYAGVLFVLALLVFFGIARDVISAPRIILIISSSLVYAFWPFSFISMLVISRLYKKIPELQS